MSNEITFRYLNAEEQEQFLFCVYQALTACGHQPTDLDQITPALCQQFQLADIGHIRPEQVQPAREWIFSVWVFDALENRIKSAYESLSAMLKEVRSAYLLLLRQRAMLATKKQWLVVVLMLVLCLPSPLPARAAQVASKRMAAIRFDLTTPATSQDGQIIAQPYAATSEADVLLRATATLEANPFPNVQDADLIVRAVNYAGNFSVSAVVDRAFLEDCVDGFPMAALMKANMRLDAAVLTEIPGTNYSPVIYTLAAMDTAGDINKGPLMIYFGTLLGPKAFLSRTPPANPSRVPSLGEDFGLLWQNGFTTVADKLQRPGRGPMDDCLICLDSVKANAARVRDGKVIAAGAVATAAGIGCAAITVGVFAVICFAAAAAALIGTLKWIHAEYDEKIYNAKRGICAVNRETGQSCQWER